MRQYAKRPIVSGINIDKLTNKQKTTLKQELVANIGEYKCDLTDKPIRALWNKLFPNFSLENVTLDKYLEK